MIKPGVYRHFKGDLYIVLGTAHHTETQEELALYLSVDHTVTGFFVRPIDSFQEITDTGVRRFTYLKETL